MDYQKVVYGKYPKSKYPYKLSKHLVTYYFPIENAKLLDVGCGDNTYVNHFKKMRLETYGIDDEINFEKDKFPYPSNTFDYVFTKSVIEHVENTEHFLSEIYRILKPGGTVLILTPAWEYNYRWFYDDPTHIKPFHRKGLQDALRLMDFQREYVEYFYHLPFFWKYPNFEFLASLVRLLPDDWRWKDWGQQYMNVNIRFCKEVQLIATAEK